MTICAWAFIVILVSSVVAITCCIRWGRRFDAHCARVINGYSRQIQTQRVSLRAGELARRRDRFTCVATHDINMGAIIQIESSGNPRPPDSHAGARGLCQIRRPAWEECTRLMGLTWTWDDDSWQPGENRAVGKFYMNVRIPQMLRAYGIDDNDATRIGAYDWGIGNLREAWNQYGHDWLAHAPQETQDYVAKYAAIMAQAR